MTLSRAPHWIKHTVFAGTFALTAQAAPLVLTEELPLLFVDDSGVAQRDGLVRTVHAARTQPKPVVVADQAWEGDRVYIYGSVYFDAGKGRYVMWYLARPGREQQGSLSGKGQITSLRDHGFDVVLYATSKDGLTWEKAPLNILAADEIPNNNIVYDMHSPSVLRDEGAPASERYKMLASTPEGYRAAVSPDGIHWTPAVEEPVLAHWDTITLSQDPRTGEYLAYHKRPAEVRGFPRRVVWLSRSKDFRHWSEPKLVFVPDETDDQWVSLPQERPEVYNMSVYPHAAGFVGFPAIFRVQKVRPRETLSSGQSPLDGPLDIQLATSADGENWRRSWPRINMIPRGQPGTFDSGALLGVSSTWVHTAEQTWVYYTAISTGHGGPIPPKKISIGRAEWRRHGLVSLDAGPDGGALVTSAIKLGTAPLVLNADASLGEVTYALLDADGNALPGYDYADAKPLCGDQLAWKLEWRGSTKLPSGQEVKLGLRLRNTRLYSVGIQIAAGNQ